MNAALKSMNKSYRPQTLKGSITFLKFLTVMYLYSDITVNSLWKTVWIVLYFFAKIETFTLLQDCIISSEDVNIGSGGGQDPHLQFRKDFKGTLQLS